MKLKMLDYFEWQTVLLIAGCYLTWFSLVLSGDALPLWIWIPAVALTTTFYLSIVHEVVHGHPTSSPILNHLLVGIPVGWVFPYERFRDTHLAHHETGELTDPLDDPESWYVYVDKWQNVGPALRMILTFNNTLAGRMLIGPVITLSRFLGAEIATFFCVREIRFYLARVWFLHLILCALLIAFIMQFGSQPGWAYLIVAYLGISILLIRTFLEHQASENHYERTVLIEKTCPIAFLFLFNNLHALHHLKPGIPWYRLPGYYREKRAELLQSNNHYVYSSYGEVFKKYFFRPKEPVFHPIAGPTPKAWES